LTYDCECQYGSRVQERVIICRLARYCQIDDDIIMIGDKFDIYAADGSVQHRCTCLKGDRYTNKLECKSAKKGSSQTQQQQQERKSQPEPEPQSANSYENAQPYENNEQSIESAEDAWDNVEPLSLDELERLASDDYDTDWDGMDNINPDDYPNLYE